MTPKPLGQQAAAARGHLLSVRGEPGDLGAAPPVAGTSVVCPP